MSDDADAITRDAIFRVKRGLCGYVSYLAACEMNQAFSEYLLYEPVLRILTSRNYTVLCEYECPGIAQPMKGDKKRLDFYAERHPSRLALEVKWIKRNNPSISTDSEKLQAFASCSPGAFAFILVFGRKSHIRKITIDKDLYQEWGSAVYADFRKTKYGCRVFRLKTSGPATRDSKVGSNRRGRIS